MPVSEIAIYVARAAGFALTVGALWYAGRSRFLRVRNRTPDRRREQQLLIFVVYIAALTEIIALRIGKAPVERDLRLIPLETTLGMLKHGLWFFFYHLIGNIVWFMPLGAFLYRFGPVQALLAGAGVSLTLEALQWILCRGVADIDDVLINALGAFLGAWLARSFFNRQKSH